MHNNVKVLNKYLNCMLKNGYYGKWQMVNVEVHTFYHWPLHWSSVTVHIQIVPFNKPRCTVYETITTIKMTYPPPPKFLLTMFSISRVPLCLQAITDLCSALQIVHFLSLCKQMYFICLLLSTRTIVWIYLFCIYKYLFLLLLS